MFRIGEFSKIAQTPITQLRYYDQIGLFQPEQIDQFTGYRYYKASQLPDLNRILAMKGLGLTLEQIQRLVVDSVSADEIRGMLSLKKAQIEQELQGQMMTLRQIEARLKQVEKEGELSKGKMTSLQFNKKTTRRSERLEVIYLSPSPFLLLLCTAVWQRGSRFQSRAPLLLLYFECCCCFPPFCSTGQYFSPSFSKRRKLGLLFIEL